MNIEEFAAFTVEKIRDYLPEEEQNAVTIETAEVIKSNDQKLHGISFWKGDDPSPTFYVEDLYDLYSKGVEVETIMESLADSYMQTKSGPVPEGMPDLDFESIRQNLGLRLLGIEYNEEFLKQVLYREVGFGMALVCDVRAGSSDGGIFSTVITKDLADSYGYNEDEVFEAAFENSWTTSAPVFEPVGKVLYGEDGIEDSTAYVLTLYNPRFGAAALFYPGVQEMVADVLNESYYAIPSSIHEFMIVRESAVPDPEGLAQDIIAANETLLEPQEVLSNNLLHYNMETGKLTAMSAEI